MTKTVADSSSVDSLTATQCRQKQQQNSDSNNVDRTAPSTAAPKLTGSPRRQQQQSSNSYNVDSSTNVNSSANSDSSKQHWQQQQCLQLSSNRADSRNSDNSCSDVNCCKSLTAASSTETATPTAAPATCIPNIKHQTLVGVLLVAQPAIVSPLSRSPATVAASYSPITSWHSLPAFVAIPKLMSACHWFPALITSTCLLLSSLSLLLFSHLGLKREPLSSHRTKIKIILLLLLFCPT